MEIVQQNKIIKAIKTIKIVFRCLKGAGGVDKAVASQTQGEIENAVVLRAVLRKKLFPCYESEGR